MRRLAALLLASAGLVWAAPTSAFACSCAPPPVPQQAEQASAVFVGTLTEIDGDTETDADAETDAGTDAGTDADTDTDAEIARVPASDTTTYVVEVAEVFKGEVAPRVEVDSPSSGATCGLEGMQQGERYVFFVQEQEAGYFADLCSGTTAATPRLENRLTNLLGDGQEVTAPPPVEWTTVADSEATSFTRLAAPGGALILVGLLGLVLVRAISRER